MARVVLAMSGGVDSSVAAHLLHQAGHEVIGLFMRHGHRAEPSACSAPASSGSSGGSDFLPIVSRSSVHKQGCCSASDAADARRIADQLGIPFYALDFEEEFGQIIDYFVDEYVAGRTPNPCVMCNNWLKFGRLCDYADAVGAEYIATGHYARLVPIEGQPPALCRGLDASKDQSYVLFGVARDVFSRVLFPVGEYHKSDIRRMAHDMGLRVADKPDSQEICFVPAGEHGELIRERCADTDLSGELVSTDGEILGQHAGIQHFTIGQRKGLGLAFGEPRYVVRIDGPTRRVVIGTKDDLARTELTAQRSNWLVDPPNDPLRCRAQIRYRGEAADAMVEPLPGDRLRVTFDEPRHGVAPGQAVVCYDSDRVLCGGWIE